MNEWDYYDPWIPDTVLLRIVDAIDRSMTRPKYEELMVSLDLYSLGRLREDEEYFKLSKRNLIIKTFKENDEKLLLNTLHEKDILGDDVYRALANIGYEFENSLAGELAQPVEENSRLEIGLSNLGMNQVQHFLEQSLDNYVQRNYEAANAMTRTALEHFVESIATKISVLHGGEIIPLTGKYLTPADIRRYLHEKGFLDTSEKELLDKFYGYASTNRPHPGISSEAEARLRRFVVIGIALLYIEKLNDDSFMKSLV